MRLFALLLVSLALLYFGGFYHAPAFAAAAVAVWAVAAVLLALALLARRGLRVTVRLPEGGVRRMEPFTCTVEVENRSVFPAGRFSVTLTCRTQGKTVLTQKVRGSVGGRGRTAIDLPLTARHAGLLTVEAAQLRVWDLLALHAFRKKVDARAEAVLLPPLLELPVALERAALLPAEEDGALGVLDGAPPEVREIDAYRPGDAMRDVHWKLSARQDTLLTKRYSLETRPRFCVWWELCAGEPADADAADAFWALCFALSAGLLAAEAPHDLRWYDAAEKRVERRRIEDREDLLRALTALLRREKPFGGGPLPEAVQAERFRDAAAGETVLTIDTAPCLFLDTHAVLRLNGEHYVEEIGKNRILL